MRTPSNDSIMLPNVLEIMLLEPHLLRIQLASHRPRTPPSAPDASNDVLKKIRDKRRRDLMEESKSLGHLKLRVATAS